MLAGEVDVRGIDSALFQDLAQEVEDLGIPDVGIVAGVDRLDHRLASGALDLIAAVFRHENARICLGLFIVFLDLGDGERHAVSLAQVAYLHADIGPCALGREYHRFFARSIGKGLVVAVVNIHGLAEEKFAHSVVAGDGEAKLVLFADLQLDPRVIEKLGVPDVVVASQIGDGDHVAVDGIAAIHCVGIARRLILLRSGRSGRGSRSGFDDAGGDRVALAEISELHADIESVAFGPEGHGFRTRSIHEGGIITVIQIRGLADEKLTHAVVALKAETELVGLADFQSDTGIIEQLGIPDIVVLAGIGGDDHAVADVHRAVFRAQQGRRFRLGQFAQPRDFGRDGMTLAQIADLHADIDLVSLGRKADASAAFFRAEGHVVAVVDILAFAQEELAHAVFSGEGEAQLVLFARRQLHPGVRKELGAPDVVVVVRVRDDQRAAVDVGRAVLRQLDVRGGNTDRAVRIAF